MNVNMNTLSEDAKLSHFMGTVLASSQDDFKHRYLTALSKLDESQWKELEKATTLPFLTGKDEENEKAE